MHDRLTELRTTELIERLSTSAPTPGGGSAAALAGAMGAGLIEMVVALTSGRPAVADHEAELSAIGATAGKLRRELLALTDADAVAYETVISARRLARDTDTQREARDAAIADATRDATLTPLRTARAAYGILELAERLAPIGNRNAISDVGAAALLAAAAVRGAALNVRINLPYLAEDDPLRADAATEIDRLQSGLDEREVALRRTVEAAIG